ncbi:MAG: hypothetical protein IT371_07300 [Deltaproteobacteria bacterium]|nr:hypothetical protein [Deltaproteobacteria bacterium]
MAGDRPRPGPGGGPSGKTPRKEDDLQGWGEQFDSLVREDDTFADRTPPEGFELPQGETELPSTASLWNLDRLDAEEAPHEVTLEQDAANPADDLFGPPGDLDFGAPLDEELSARREPSVPAVFTSASGEFLTTEPPPRPPMGEVASPMTTEPYAALGPDDVEGAETEGADEGLSDPFASVSVDVELSEPEAMPDAFPPLAHSVPTAGMAALSAERPSPGAGRQTDALRDLGSWGELLEEPAATGEPEELATPVASHEALSRLAVTATDELEERGTQRPTARGIGTVTTEPGTGAPPVPAPPSPVAAPPASASTSAPSPTAPTAGTRAVGSAAPPAPAGPLRTTATPPPAGRPPTSVTGAPSAPTTFAPSAPAQDKPRVPPLSSLSIQAAIAPPRPKPTTREVRTAVSSASEASAGPDARPAIEPLPLDQTLLEGEESWLGDYQVFKTVTQRLARMGEWRRLAAVTGHTLVRAEYATGTTRTALLLDLARMYRDRLADELRAEQAFAALAKDDPASAEALDYLTDRYQRQGAWEAIYDLYQSAVEATWDPNDRLEWTRRSASLATERIGQVELAIKAWEHLWQLGDAIDEASRALAGLYRQAGRWADMASFLQQQADRLQGAARLVVLRQLAEVKLSAQRLPDEASRVLEQIVEQSPQDPIATLQLARVYAQRKDWGSLERLGKRAAAEQVPPAAAMDLLRLVADSLWQAGRLAQAVEAYDRILEADPADHEGTSRKREFLIRSGKYADLLALLVAKADSTDDDDERAQILAEAAQLAETELKDLPQAVRLWERRVTIDPEHLPSFDALARIYEALGDARGIARALEGQLALTKELRRRIELLRRLGHHYSQRMGDDERAEGCWKEILGLDPSDLLVREELIALHRRRGAYEALNSALLRQIWLTQDRERAESLCRIAAENLDEHFQEPPRSVEAWRRVLDYAPQDLQALKALARHYQALDQRRELVAALEQQIESTDDPVARTQLTLQVGRLWEQEKAGRAAAAAYERVLRWDPVNGAALEALVRLYRQNNQTGKAIGALEHASVLTLDTARRIELLRTCLGLLPLEDHTARFWLLRRILFLGPANREVIEELKTEADAEPSLWPEMAAVITQLGCQQPSSVERAELLQELSWLCEQKLDGPGRAYVAAQAALLGPATAPESLDELRRLARSTRRHEDLLGVLDRLATPEFPLHQRKEAIRERAAICELDLRDPIRAFHEYRRLLELDAVDWEPLTELDRLAADHQLWTQLDATFAELWDRTNSDRDRLELLARRDRVARQKLQSRGTAFDHLWRRFRIRADDGELLRLLTEDAEALGGWEWALPQLEAALLAQGDEAPTDQLGQLAGLYEQKLGDVERSFALYSEAFWRNPVAPDLPGKLEQLAARIDRYETLAHTLREAAARLPDGDVKLDLFHRIAAIYEQKLHAPARAIDIHRRILDLKPEEMRSLDVMLDWHRERKEWRDLRDRLHQWVRLAPAHQNRVPKLLEVAHLSEQHLRDAEAALEAYGQVLELDPEQRDARRGLEGLVLSITEPGLRLRWLRMELRRATAVRALELRLEIASLQEDELQDGAGAIETLTSLVEETGADGPGFAPLARLLRQEKRFKELVVLLKRRAEQASDPALKLASLDEALTICKDHLDEAEPELREALYRFVLTLRPTDRAVRVRLARLLRNHARWADVCGVLEEQLHHTPQPSERVALLHEVARLQALSLSEPDRAENTWQRILKEVPGEEGALLALARRALGRNDLDRYLELRLEQARRLPPREAALVLCHLAELCDETPRLHERMLPFYREARGTDAENVPAMEALKGIGRRLKNLRPAAALLPLDGERDLSPSERAVRLKALGDASLDQDLPSAVEWYLRATAVNPDHAAAWEALAAALERLPDPGGVFRAGRSWLYALQRTEALSPERLREETERLYVLASSARAAGHEEVYVQLVRQAYELVPGYAPAALAMAHYLIDRDQVDEAHILLDDILVHHLADLGEDQKVVAYFGRGRTLRRMGKRDQAMEDFRQSLQRTPLNADCLMSMGTLQAEAGRVAASLEYQIRALTVMQDATGRARLYHRIGVLWEDGLKATHEAGACYELALAEGLGERDLLHRALRHFQRTGRLDQSLEVVDGLLPTATDADELATLWLVRGEIFAAREGRENEAIEAFDMALSYDPSRQEAREGLTMVLERRGDWLQLLQVLEASCDVGTPEQRSQALLRMADICSLQLGDPDRAEHYLRASVEASPTRRALEQLERIYATPPERVRERRDALGLLVAFGPPWFDRVTELAKLLLSEEKRWAWCLLSPLLGVSQIDPDLKAVVQAMRKEYERPPMLSSSAERHPLLSHTPAHDALRAVLAEVEAAVKPIGIATVDSVGDGAAIGISTATTLGKSFAALADAMQLAGCTLYRTQEQPESVAIVNGEQGPSVIVRTEVMQQLVHAEVGFLFAYALELCRPGHRAIAALPRDGRDQLVPALWLALGFTREAGKQATKLATRIRETAVEGTLARWTEWLGSLQGQDPLALGRSYWSGVCHTARRAGLLAGADLRQAFRVVSRLEEPEVPRPRVVARMDELDEYVASSAVLQDLVGFAASPSFGELMRTSRVADGA